MRVYFLSEKPCGLTVSGIYLGLIDGFERSAELSPADELFLECRPQGEYLPVSFRFDEEFLCSPPPQVSLYFTERSVAVYISDFVPADRSIKVHSQKRLGGTLLTLLSQGKLQIDLENETGFHMTELPDVLENAEILPAGNGFLLRAEEAFALLSRTGEIELFSEGRVLSFENGVEAEVPFHDSQGHTALMKWQNGALVSCSIRTPAEPTEATFALALFESALIGADVRPFLCEELAQKADKLKEFLGDYRSVALTEERNKVGLVYERKPRVFDVRYFRIELEKDKIKNILPL